MPVCDECRQEYDPPVYYTLDSDDHPTDNWTLSVEECTGNLCPECSGPYLEPDDPKDPRRPTGLP